MNLNRIISLMNKQINQLLDENTKLQTENGYLRTLLHYTTESVADKSEDNRKCKHGRPRRSKCLRVRTRKTIKN